MALWSGRFILCLALALVATCPARADSVAQLAQDVQKAEGVRAVKALQNTYDQYAQAGLWSEMASLFANQGEAVVGNEDIKGPNAIRDYLARLNNGREGLPTGALNIRMLFEQEVDVAPDGKSAKGRWRELSMLASGKGDASWDSGIFENQYVKDNGVWKIARLTYAPQFGGSVEKGWHFYDSDLKVTPYHFTSEQAGTPVILSANDVTSAKPADIAVLSAHIRALNDEDNIHNLQNAYGYYVDQKMWVDVTDLFAPDGILELSGVEPSRGAEGIRRSLEKDGPAGLKRGELNDHIQLDTVVKVSPGGQDAHARGLELGLLGDVDHSQAQYWTVSVFRNRYSKGKDGVWRIREMHIYPIMKADFVQGWGSGNLVGSGAALPAFFANPVTGRKIVAPAGLHVVAGTDLLAAGKPSPTKTLDLAMARRALSRSIGYDAVENIATAFGNWIADDQWTDLGNLFAANGMRQYPSVGSYKGPARIAKSESVRNGDLPHPRTNIGPHIMAQPVIDVAEDGRTARYRTRLFQLSASATRPGNIAGGMYNNQAVFDHGVWKLWSVAIDEFYYQGDLTVGWSKWTPRGDPKPTKLDTDYLPDIPRRVLGRREEGIHGGPTPSIDWPDIKPMWFFYTNPVSGRIPPNYWPDCVTCVYDSATSAKANGY